MEDDQKKQSEENRKTNTFFGGVRDEIKVLKDKALNEVESLKNPKRHSCTNQFFGLSMMINPVVER